VKYWFDKSAVGYEILWPCYRFCHVNAQTSYCDAWLHLSSFSK
jgi:hypothetical protein